MTKKYRYYFQCYDKDDKPEDGLDVSVISVSRDLARKRAMDLSEKQHGTLYRIKELQKRLG